MNERSGSYQTTIIVNNKERAMTKFTKEQAIIITGFTGKLACNFSEFHGDVEKRIGRSVFTHEFGNKQFSKQVEELYREDFLSMVGVEE